MVDPSQYLRMQNLFGATPGSIQAPPPDAPLTAPPLMGQPKANPWDNISMTPAASNSVPNTPPEIQPAETPASTSVSGGRRLADMMTQMYQPETAASDRLNTMISSYPKREDNQPSMLRRIGGALMAVGGSLPQGRGMGFYHANPQAIEEGQAFMNKPFENKLEDWKNQIQPAESAATLERYRNVNERTMAYQSASMQLRDEAEAHKVANDAANMAIKQHRADVYEYKAMHPGAKFDFRGPTVLVADPITKEVHDTGVPTGHLTELDKMNLSQEQSLERIGATGDEARKTEGVRQQGREALQNLKGWDTRDIIDPDDPAGIRKISVRVNQDTGETQRLTLDGKQVRGAGRNQRTGAGDKPETPTQTRVRQFNTARELYNTRPDLRPFIKLGNPGSNDFTVTPPSDTNFFGYKSHSGPSQTLYEEARDKIYGNTIVAPVSSHAPTTVGSPPVSSANAAGVPQNGPDLGKNPPPRGGTNEMMKSPKNAKYKDVRIPQDRVLIVDKDGNPAGSIPDTPEQRTLAAKKYTVID